MCVCNKTNEQAKTAEDKVAASKAMDTAKELKRQAQAEKAKDAHLFAKVSFSSSNKRVSVFPTPSIRSNIITHSIPQIDPK